MERLCEVKDADAAPRKRKRKGNRKEMGKGEIWGCEIGEEE